MTRRSASSAHRGQSLAEFAVLMLALVPLFLAIPLLGKYQDLAHMSESAARYPASKPRRPRRGGRRTDAELAQEVRRRFFGNSDAAIKTGDVAGDFATHRNPLWVDHSGRPLLEHVETDVATPRSLRSGRSRRPDPGHECFGLPDSELHEGVVTVRPRDIANLPPLMLSVSKSAAIRYCLHTAGQRRAPTIWQIASRADARSFIRLRR